MTHGVGLCVRRRRERGCALRQVRCCSRTAVRCGATKKRRAAVGLRCAAAAGSVCRCVRWSLLGKARRGVETVARVAQAEAAGGEGSGTGAQKRPSRGERARWLCPSLFARVCPPALSTAPPVVDRRSPCVDSIQPRRSPLHRRRGVCVVRGGGCPTVPSACMLVRGGVLRGVGGWLPAVELGCTFVEFGSSSPSASGGVLRCFRSGDDVQQHKQHLTQHDQHTNTANPR